MAKNVKIVYHLDHGAEILDRAVMLIGWAMFLRIAYFFAFTRLEEVGFFRIFFSLIIPLLVEAAFLILIRGLKLKDTQLYGVLLSALCVLMMIQSLGYDSILRLLLGVIAYLVCTAAPMLVLYGLIPKDVAKWGLIGVAGLRLLCFNLIQNLFGFHWITLLYECSAMLELVGIGLIMDALRRKK